MAIANYNRSIPELLADVVNNFTVLVRKEAQLARVEMSEKIGDLALGIGLLVGGAVLLIPALVILLQAAVAGLVAAGIASAWASLIIGGVALLIGFVLLAIGIGRLKAARPVPTRTIEQLQLDAEIAKQQVRNEDGTTKRAA
jgi:Putative Actinobacterial Holin-X, holin superfamily III